jgi:hypothetical protein
VRVARGSSRTAVVPLATSTLALAASLALHPITPIGPFLMFLGAVVCSAWWSGRAGGLAATALATIALDYFFEEVRYSFRPDSLETVLELAVFVLVALLVSSVSGSMLEARERAEAALGRLEVAQTESERRRRRLEGLREALVAVSSDRPLPDVLSAIVGEAVALLGTDAVALFVLHEPSGQLRLEAETPATSGLMPARVAGAGGTELAVGGG